MMIRRKIRRFWNLVMGKKGKIAKMQSIRKYLVLCILNEKKGRSKVTDPWESIINFSIYLYPSAGIVQMKICSDLSSDFLLFRPPSTGTFSQHLAAKLLDVRSPSNVRSCKHDVHPPALSLKMPGAERTEVPPRSRHPSSE